MKKHTKTYIWVSLGVYLLYQIFLFVNSTLIYTMIHDYMTWDWLDMIIRKCGSDFKIKPNKMFL